MTRSRMPFQSVARLVASAFVAALFALTAVTAVQASPNILTVERKDPTSENTDADALTWLLTFSEPVTDVDATDFVVSGTTASLALSPLALDGEGCSEQWDATLSGGDLKDLNATVTLAPASFDVDDHSACELRSSGPCIWGLHRQWRSNDASRPLWYESQHVHPDQLIVSVGSTPTADSPDAGEGFR